MRASIRAICRGALAALHDAPTRGIEVRAADSRTGVLAPDLGSRKGIEVSDRGG